MRIFLALFMALIVSGDDVTITGILEDSVLLPCPCSERNLDMEVKWQMEEPRPTLVLKYNKSISNLYGRYKGRVKILLHENSNNCSVLLTNITEDDMGKYRCVFNSQGKYNKLFVNLNISANYNVCQSDSASNLKGQSDVPKVFQCDAKGRYREAEIQWNLDGQPLTNSSSIQITHTSTLDASTGFYHFTSKLTTTLNRISSPTCDVKAKGISTIIRYDCRTETESLRTNSDSPKPEDNMRYRYLKIIPIMLTLGFSVVLWRNSHRVFRR